MERIALQVAGFIAITLLAACGTPPITVDTVGKKLSDPVLLSPGTKGMRGGQVRVPLPEFEMDSLTPFEVEVVAKELRATFTLEKSFGKLYAKIPQASFQYLAGLPDLPKLLFTALKTSSPRLRNGTADYDARLALAMSLAERLPRRNSMLWNDAYNYDPSVRALSLVPGMRVRLETMMPVTADVTRAKTERSQGSVMPASYLNVFQSADGVGVMLAPTLEELKVRSEDPCDEDPVCPQFKYASGIHNLLGTENRLRFWTLFYPDSLGGLDHTDYPIAFVNEILTARPNSVPGVLLVGSSGPEGMADFIAEAKALRKRTSPNTGINCSIAPGKVACFILRYRVLPVPEILVTVQDAPVWVEIGTTLGMVLATHETVRVTASFAGEQFSAGDAWRNRQNRIPLEHIDFSRVHMGVRSRVVTQPNMGEADDAIRRITLQAGDEIKWAD